VYDETLEQGDRLRNKRITVINRSEVVGRPLAAMLANDGAKVGFLRGIKPFVMAHLALSLRVLL
jgi:5,10-methylene-tetrahydrofolate dehydrogenase/methenyl tetrahydrofolate cyclohydrolase